MLGALAECACRCPGGTGLGDFPATWEYDREKQQFWFTSPSNNVKVWAPGKVSDKDADAFVAKAESLGTPESWYASRVAAASGSGSSTGGTTVGQDISSALKAAFSVPGEVLGVVSKDPVLGPLAAFGIAAGMQKAGIKQPQAPPAPAQGWTTGEKIAAAAGVALLAGGLGYALSRR